jgi:hypothetical protein
MNHHVHVAGLAILCIVSVMVCTNYLVRTVSAHHADSPWAQGLAYVL